MIKLVDLLREESDYRLDRRKSIAFLDQLNKYILSKLPSNLSSQVKVGDAGPGKNNTYNSAIVIEKSFDDGDDYNENYGGWKVVFRLELNNNILRAQIYPSIYIFRGNNDEHYVSDDGKKVVYWKTKINSRGRDSQIVKIYPRLQDYDEVFLMRKEANLKEFLDTQINDFTKLVPQVEKRFDEIEDFIASQY